MFRPLRFSTLRALQSTVRYQSTSSSPSLLTKIRTDLKDAMRARDKTRLAVLRALISEVNNAAKSPRPIDTDVGLVQLIRNRSDAVKTAREEYAQQNRNDLTENADAELGVLTEYANMVESATAEDIQQAVAQAIEKLKQDGQKPVMGRVMKHVSSEESPLHGKFAEASDVARTAKEALDKL